MNIRIIGTFFLLFGLAIGGIAGYFLPNLPVFDTGTSKMNPTQNKLATNITTRNQVYVPREYVMPYITGSLNINYQMHLGISQAPHKI